MKLLEQNFPQIKVDLPEKHVLELSLNNPDQRNAITDEIIEGLESLLKLAEKEEQVRVVLLTGEGSGFSAGGDLKAMQSKTGMFKGSSEVLRYRYQTGIQRIPLAISTFEKPIIAAVNGAAIGAGLDIACMCDIRVASERAKFGETFVKLGLISGDGGSLFLQRVVGFAKAMELSLTGDVLSAEEALKIGLVNQVVPHDELKEAARLYARKIARNSPTAVRLMKKALYSARLQTVPEHLEQASLLQAITQRTKDHEVGVDAILAKNSASFPGEDYS